MQRHIKNDLLYLLRIVEASKKIQLYSAGFETWLQLYISNNQLEFNACLNQLIQIGEQAKKLSETLTDKYQHISWHTIKGFRNRIVHEYIAVETEYVFEIIQINIPELIENIIPIIIQELNNGNFEMDELEIAKTSPYLTHVDFSKFK